MEKPLPSDLNAERATLGSILLDRDAIIPVAPWLASEYFYLEKHAWMYEAMVACYNRRVPPDIVNVSDELRRHNRLEQIGGSSYLIEVSNSVPTAVHVEFYGRIVERTALLRRLISAGGKIASIGFDETDDVDQALDRAEAELFAVSQRRANQGFVHIGQVVDNFYDQISQMQERGGEIVGIRTGFHDFDKLTGGLQRSDLLILAARPATGKTSLALNLAYNVARDGGCVAIFSLEMSRDQLVQRILATETGVDMQKIRTGQIHDNELNLLTDALGKLSTLYLYIDDSPGVSIMEVRSKCRRLQAETGVDLVIIDYLQLMQGSSRRDANRVQEISEISRGLKALAREVNVPVIALSQLSRAVESRTSHVPMLSDLRESGCVAGDTLVYLPDEGVYRRIDSLIGRVGFNVLALNTETWKHELRPVTNAFCTGVKPVFQISTNLGRTIRATANHKFLTMDGWKRLDELAPGMHVAVPRQLQGPSESTLSDAELALLALLMGDGCTLAQQPIHYATADAGLAEYVARLSREVFGDAVAPRVSPEGSWVHVCLATSQRSTHGVRNPVAAWLDSLGVFDLRSHEKWVPDQVFRQNPESIACFLRHLWAADGCAHGSDTHYPTVYYASRSLRFASDVQSLLLRVSINARLKRGSQSNKEHDQYYVIVDSKADLSRFAELIGCVGQRNLASLLAYEKKSAVSTATAMSRQPALAIAQAMKSDSLARIAQSDVYWDEIASIVPQGQETVYDLTVDGLHNFVGQNFTLHNSIEQDADIVLFIYREELYDPDTDKKGIAELHLAKHRNGPTGIVPLRFFRSTTRFANLETYRQPEGY